MLFAIAATVLIGLGAAAMLHSRSLQDSAEKPDYGPTKAAPEVKRALYEVHSDEVTPEVPVGALERRAGDEEVRDTVKVTPGKSERLRPAQQPRNASKKTPSAATVKRTTDLGGKRVNESAQKEAERVGKVKKMSAKEFARLSATQGGKAEIKLPTGSKTLSDQRKRKAEKTGPTTFSDRAKKVTGIIAKKRRLLVQCKSGEDQKVKVTFTIALTGKVTSVRIKGTKNERKKSCIANVFWRSIFPKGETSETFSLPFTI
jgi:hypothetical protein